MKNKNLFCIKKKTLVYIIIVVLIYFFIFILSQVSVSQKKSLQSKAAPAGRYSKKGPLPIIGGSNVLINEYPSVALVYVGGGFCTGTLIAPRWILTAAHCLQGPIEDLSVAVGIINRNNYRENRIKALKKIPHPQYNIPVGSGINDIGLILLESSITIASYPKIPKLNKNDKMYATGNSVTVVGWGCSDIAKNKIKDAWQICSQYKTVGDCNKNGWSQGCGFHMDCNLCMPGNRNEEINYEGTINNCEDLRKTAKLYEKKPEITITPYLEENNMILSNILQKINFFISMSEYKDRPMEFGLGENMNERICAGDSGGPVFYKANDGLYIIGTVVSMASKTKVIKFGYWIKKTMEETIVPSPVATATPIPPIIYSKEDFKKIKTCSSYRTERDCENHMLSNERCSTYYFPGECSLLCLPYSVIYGLFDSGLADSWYPETICQYFQRLINQTKNPNNYNKVKME